MAAFVLALIGGILILVAGFFEFLIGSAVGIYVVGPGLGFLVLFGALGIVLGLLVMVFGILAYSNPHQHVAYGVLILVFSIISLVSFGGGFIFGFVLALIGGILAIVHRPVPVRPAVPYMMAPPVLRVCPKCGRAVEPYVHFCPHCGNPLG